MKNTNKGGAVVSVLHQQPTARIGIFLRTSTSSDGYNVPCFGRLLVKNTNKGGGIGIFLRTSTSSDGYKVPYFGRLLVKNTNKGG
ncbi:MAG TPA: hypothetical protein VK517_00485, partial [Cyclobacteriaceae bacterium]|nr:hypothetical protein [Cyclobacteriaceae bacterium]